MILLRTIFLTFIICSSLAVSAQTGLLLNELVANNETTFYDQDGDATDWIEIYNLSDHSINLKGYIIADSNAEWIFPEVSILPNRYLIVFASDKDKYVDQELHTNFKLAKDGEQVQLLDPSRQIIDSIDFPSLKEDESFGRSADDISLWRKFNRGTPNQANMESENQADLIAFSSSHESGFYPEGLELSFPSLKEEQVVYYTLDGSKPNTASLKCQKGESIPIRNEVDNTIAFINTSVDFETPEGDFPTAAIFRAQIFEGDNFVSEVLDQSFWLSPNPHSIPIVSLIGEEADFFDEERGIYVEGNNNNYFQRGREWERPIDVSFFDYSGALILKQSAGIRLGGANTRFKPQKTMRLFARSDYGKSTFDYPFWGEEYGNEFKRITLRTLYIGPYSKAAIMDDLVHEIVDGNINGEYVKRNFSVVYINGVYWGIHSMREHNNQHYIERKYGVPEDEVIVAKTEFGENDSLNFNLLVRDIATMDLTNSDDFQEVADRIDIEQYADYIITNLAIANRDWPHNNVEYWYAPSFDDKLRFIINDLDASMTLHNDERLELFIADQTDRMEREEWFDNLIILQKLLEAPTYRTYFNQRLNELLHTTFSPSNTIPILEDMVEELSPEIEAHINRWHFQKNRKQWESAIDGLEEFLLRRPMYLIDRSNELFGFPIKAYPNPIADQLFVEFDAWADGMLYVEVFDIHGRLVSESSFPVLEGAQKINMDTDQMILGTFILRLKFKGLQVNKRLVKFRQ